MLFADDEHSKTYTDLTGPDQTIGWTGDTTKVPLNADQTLENYFQSGIGRDYIGAATDKFSAVQFHFHTPSEHTVNEQHYDLEMHTVHVAEEVGDGNIGYAAVGIMFDVNYYDPDITEDEQAIIDEFLD